MPQMIYAVMPLDAVGRITIPKLIRDRLGLVDSALMEVTADVREGDIILRRYRRSCILCGATIPDEVLKSLIPSGKVFVFEGKHICSQCLKRIKLVLEGQKRAGGDASEK